MKTLIIASTLLVASSFTHANEPEIDLREDAMYYCSEDAYATISKPWASKGKASVYQGGKLTLKVKGESVTFVRNNIKYSLTSGHPSSNHLFADNRQASISMWTHQNPNRLEFSSHFQAMSTGEDEKVVEHYSISQGTCTKW